MDNTKAEIDRRTRKIVKRIVDTDWVTKNISHYDLLVGSLVFSKTGRLKRMKLAMLFRVDAVPYPRGAIDCFSELFWKFVRELNAGGFKVKFKKTEMPTMGSTECVVHFVVKEL